MMELPFERYRREIQEIKTGQLRPIALSLCNLEHKNGDLFRAHHPYKGHAVAGDLKMSAGFAAKYVQIYGRVRFMQRFPPSLYPGCVINTWTERKSDYPCAVWLHIITKERSPDKIRHGPSRFVENVLKGLDGLARHCYHENIRDLGITALCTGLDQMDPEWINYQIKRAFKDQEIKITMYHF
jgi:hypothetical protein